MKQADKKMEFPKGSFLMQYTFDNRYFDLKINQLMVTTGPIAKKFLIEQIKASGEVDSVFDLKIWSGGKYFPDMKAHHYGIYLKGKTLYARSKRVWPEEWSRIPDLNKQKKGL